MTSVLEETVGALVIQYLNKLIDDVVQNAEAAYTAGYVRAAANLGKSITTETAQKEVQAYIQKYRYKLVQQGLLTVTSPVKNDLGDIVRYVEEDIEWMKEKPAIMRNQLVDVIQEGIRVGKPAGFRKRADGTYPDNTIAKDLQDIVGDYKSDAATIARTETARCYYNGEKDRYASSGIEYVVWSAAPDCCEMCEPYRGHIMPISECPSVPLHPNCRCDIRPAMDSEIEEYLQANR